MRFQKWQVFKVIIYLYQVKFGFLIHFRKPYKIMRIKTVLISIVTLYLFAGNSFADEGELTLYLEVHYFNYSMQITDCDRVLRIKNGEDVSDVRNLACFERDNELTLTLTGPAGTTITLYSGYNFKNEGGYLIIKKKDDRLVWLLDLESFPRGKWHTEDAKGDSGAYDVFYEGGPALNHNVSSIKWGIPPLPSP